MREANQPKIEIEDLQPKGTCGSYHATWQEGTLVAHAWLDPIRDLPANGFFLECSYNHVQLNRRLFERQMEIGSRLVANVRELMLDHMARAGWVEIGKDDKKRSIWQHTSRLAAKNSPLQSDHEQTRAEHQTANIHQEESEQVRVTEPVRVALDDFTSSPYIDSRARRNYRATAEQGDVQAIVMFSPLGHLDLEYPDAYVLQTGVDCLPFTPGATLTHEQEQRASDLLIDLRLKVEDALVRAGWTVRWSSPRHGDLWTSNDWRPDEQVRVTPTASPSLGQTNEYPQQVQDTGKQVRVTAQNTGESGEPLQKMLLVSASQRVRAYRRTIHAQTVTLSCAQCGQRFTRTLYPGVQPKYCDSCAPIVKRIQTRKRVQLLRDGLSKKKQKQHKKLFPVPEEERADQHLAELEQENRQLRQRLDLEQRYHQDHQVRGFKIWLKKQIGHTAFTRRLLSDELVPPRGSRGTYEAYLRRQRYSLEEMREFEHLWKAMLLQS